MNLKELSLIDRIIYYSTRVIILKSLKFQAERFKATAKATNVKFSNEFHNLHIEEIDTKITEFCYVIMKLLTPLFLGHEFGYFTIKHWKLTLNEIKQGYVELFDSKDENKRYILLLRDYQDSKISFKKGELVAFNKIAPRLGNYQIMNSNSKSLLQLPDSYKIYLKQSSDGNKKT